MRQMEPRPRPTPILATSVTLDHLPSFLLNPPGTLPIEHATGQQSQCGDPGKLHVGRQAGGVGPEHIKPKSEVCIVAKELTGASPPLPRGPSSARPLRRGAGPAHAPGHTA